MKKKNGFTLMELLIVVIIIAGFAGFAYPSYVESLERARASEAVQMLGTIQAAQQKHYVNYETYAEQFVDLSDFTPTIKDFDPNTYVFHTEYFKYELREGCATAERIGVDKGYGFHAYYNEDFIRCLFTTTSGEKICSSLTDKEKVDKYYPIY
jgi:prepilin-type N-terminal cleavage/methylation domain-containing protein